MDEKRIQEKGDISTKLMKDLKEVVGRLICKRDYSLKWYCHITNFIVISYYFIQQVKRLFISFSKEIEPLK
jgi:hypothetical protein